MRNAPSGASAGRGGPALMSSRELTKMHMERLTLDVGSFTWTPEAGLDPAVVITVVPWIRRSAGELQYPASRAGLTVEDLVQEGLVGALQAARRFNPNHIKWLAYAKQRITGAMFRAIGRRAVSIPVNQVQGLRRAGALPRMASLDAPVVDGGATLAELLPATGSQEMDAIRNGRSRDLWRALGDLTPRERRVLVMHHGLDGDPVPLDQIAASWGISGSGAQRIERMARVHLRAALARLGVTC